MTGYLQVNLLEMVQGIGENRANEILSDFTCGGLNNDVEIFLKQKAILFAKQGWSQTHLVFASYKSKPVLVGYFTLAVKMITISRDKNLSNNYRKRLSRFSVFDDNIDKYVVPMQLIGQLGKNYYNNYNTLITGDELLQIACMKVKEAQLISGGKFVYLECEDKEVLLQFYSNNGFVNFGRRSLDKDEQNIDGEYLIQMLKYMS